MTVLHRVVGLNLYKVSLTLRVPDCVRHKIKHQPPSGADMKWFWAPLREQLEPADILLGHKFIQPIWWSFAVLAINNNHYKKLDHPTDGDKYNLALSNFSLVYVSPTNAATHSACASASLEYIPAQKEIITSYKRKKAARDCTCALLTRTRLPSVKMTNQMTKEYRKGFGKLEILEIWGLFVRLPDYSGARGTTASRLSFFRRICFH